eukprot:1892479-Pleurochrysis_carterae.AAC.3
MRPRLPDAPHAHGAVRGAREHPANNEAVRLTQQAERHSFQDRAAGQMSGAARQQFRMPSGCRNSVRKAVNRPGWQPGSDSHARDENGYSSGEKRA